MERLLRVRKKLKSKKPDFKRQDHWRGGPLKSGYRKPKGIDNKSRMKLKNKAKMANVGYSSPKCVRGFHPSGLRPHRIFNIQQLKNLHHHSDLVIVGASVGNKKKKEILKEAKKRKLKIANPEVFDIEESE